MERLSQQEFSRLLQFLRDLYALRDLQAFVTYLLRRLSDVIPCDVTAYQEMDLARSASDNWVEPPEALTPDRARAWEQHMPEHPLVRHVLATRDTGPYKLSDFLTSREFRNLGLYSEVFRPIGMEDDLAIALPGPHPLVIGVSLLRSRDFTERERLIMHLLRPHLAQAHWNAKAFEE